MVFFGKVGAGWVFGVRNATSLLLMIQDRRRQRPHAAADHLDRGVGPRETEWSPAMATPL